MTPLVLRTLEAHGLLGVLDARRRGEPVSRSAIPESVDLLALGALADEIRKGEVGDVVHVFANARAKEGAIEPSAELRGLPLLREVALLRVTGPKAARVRVDWGNASLEIAQVALGFGASELSGPIANRRGLPIAEDLTKKVKGQGMVSLQALQKKEIERVLRSAGREPVFEADVVAEDESKETSVHG